MMGSAAMGRGLYNVNEKERFQMAMYISTKHNASVDNQG